MTLAIHVQTHPTDMWSLFFQVKTWVYDSNTRLNQILDAPTSYGFVDATTVSTLMPSIVTTEEEAEDYLQYSSASNVVWCNNLHVVSPSRCASVSPLHSANCYSNPIDLSLLGKLSALPNGSLVTHSFPSAFTSTSRKTSGTLSSKAPVSDGLGRPHLCPPQYNSACAIVCRARSLEHIKNRASILSQGRTRDLFLFGRSIPSFRVPPEKNRGQSLRLPLRDKILTHRSKKSFQRTENNNPCNPFARIRVLSPRPKSPIRPSVRMTSFAASAAVCWSRVSEHRALVRR